MVQSNHRSLLSLTLMLALAISLQACAGKTGKRSSKQEKSTADGAVTQTDMTRPPRTIGVERDVVVEQNPNETISFEEWKRRQEAAADSDSPDE